MGQLYAPLSIGTAKPDLAQEPVPHHLFDRLSEPIDYTVMMFRTAVMQCMQELWDRKVVPLIVGGSSYYVNALFFPPRTCEVEASLPEMYHGLTTTELWQKLLLIDPERAQQIHQGDRYRIERALCIWHHCGVLPSTMVPQFKPVGTCAFYFLTREREDLYERIDGRVAAMMAQGWLEEVKGLDRSWWEFLKRKKLLGYPELIEALEKDQPVPLGLIAKKTRAYAKRQIIFWRMLQKKLQNADPEGKYLKQIKEVNLTKFPIDLYIKQLVDELEGL